MIINKGQFCYGYSLAARSFNVQSVMLITVNLKTRCGHYPVIKHAKLGENCGLISFGNNIGFESIAYHSVKSELKRILI